eukprot:478443-Rhodomonas_salina.6
MVLLGRSKPTRDTASQGTNSAIIPRTCYAMTFTKLQRTTLSWSPSAYDVCDAQYSHTTTDAMSGTDLLPSSPLWAYARATRCPVLILCYEMPSTNLAETYMHILLPEGYQMWAYSSGTRCPAGTKMVTEPPKGLKANMARSVPHRPMQVLRDIRLYGSLSDAQFTRCQVRLCSEIKDTKSSSKYDNQTSKAIRNQIRAPMLLIQTVLNRTSFAVDFRSVCSGGRHVQYRCGTNTSTNAAPGTKASTDGASGGTKAGYKYRRLLFCLVYFHAVLVERKKFGTLGYNVPYDFNESDFAISEDCIAYYLDAYPTTPWDALRYNPRPTRPTRP